MPRPHRPDGASADGKAPQHGVVSRMPSRHQRETGRQRTHTPGRRDDEYVVPPRGSRRSPSPPRPARELLGMPPMSKRALYPWESPGGSEDTVLEFPKGHITTPPSDEALQMSRRGLLGAMAATFAAVGAEG